MQDTLFFPPLFNLFAISPNCLCGRLFNIIKAILVDRLGMALCPIRKPPLVLQVTWVRALPCLPRHHGRRDGDRWPRQSMSLPSYVCMAHFWLCGGCGNCVATISICWRNISFFVYLLACAPMERVICWKVIFTVKETKGKQGKWSHYWRKSKANKENYKPP